MATATGFRYKNTDLNSIVGIHGDGLVSMSTFNLADYGYTTPNYSDGVPCLTKNCYSDWSDLWAGETITIDYKNNRSQIVFVDKHACPIPTSSLGLTYAYSVSKSWTSAGKLYLRYRGSMSQYKWTDSGSWYDLNSFHGQFIAIQAPGGGGGGGACQNAGAFSIAIGAGGGGGGGYAIIYINLKLLCDIDSNGYIMIEQGSAGTYGGGSGTHVDTSGADGNDGGDTVVYAYYDGENHKLITVRGGYGGKGSYFNEQGKTNSGGSGGTVTNHGDTSFYKRIYSVAGKSGGASGVFSGYAFGIPYGHKSANSGTSHSTSSSYDIPILSSSAYVVRTYTVGSITYNIGSGQGPCTDGTWDYTSEGGGGGASVMGAVKNGETISRSGYGMGGYGGSSESATVHQAQSGQSGCIQIFSVK